MHQDTLIHTLIHQGYWIHCLSDLISCIIYSWQYKCIVVSHSMISYGALYVQLQWFDTDFMERDNVGGLDVLFMECDAQRASYQFPTLKQSWARYHNTHKNKYNIHCIFPWSVYICVRILRSNKHMALYWIICICMIYICIIFYIYVYIYICLFICIYIFNQICSQDKTLKNNG